MFLQFFQMPKNTCQKDNRDSTATGYNIIIYTDNIAIITSNKDKEISSSEKIVTICYALCNHCELILVTLYATQ